MPMQVQINAGHNVTIDAATEQSLTSGITSHLAHFSDRITRVELHLSDEDGADRSGPCQMLCMLEVRLAGRQPDIVKATAATVDLAVRDATHKMHHLLDGIFSRAQRH